MNLVRCEKGHFYDRDKNGDRCPYCEQMAHPQSVQPAPQPAAEPAAKPAPEPAAPAAFAQAGPAPSSQPASRPVQPVSQPIPQAAPGTPSYPEAAPSSFDEEDNCTIGYYSRVIGVEPVVGWLVCTEGEYRGESFKLKSGRNFIGRAANMDVVLSADHSISRFKHAAVIYEPRSRQFIVVPGESRELCYLNGEVVLSNLKMEAYDVLNLGNTSLMLIPCCGKRFSWEEGIVPETKKEGE